MSVAAVLDKALGLPYSVLKGLGLVHGQHRGQLLVSELLGNIHALHLADKDLGALGHGDPGKLGDLKGGLAHYLGVQGAVDDDGLAHLIEL